MPRSGRRAPGLLAEQVWARRSGTRQNSSRKIFGPAEWETSQSDQTREQQKPWRATRTTLPTRGQTVQVCFDLLKLFCTIPPARCGGITIFFRVQCTYKYSAHLNFTLMFGKKKYFYFSRIISKEIIIASLFIIQAILNPLSATFHL